MPHQPILNHSSARNTWKCPDCDSRWSRRDGSAGLSGRCAESCLTGWWTKVLVREGGRNLCAGHGWPRPSTSATRRGIASPCIPRAHQNVLNTPNVAFLCLVPVERLRAPSGFETRVHSPLPFREHCSRVSHVLREAAHARPASSCRPWCGSPIAPLNGLRIPTSGLCIRKSCGGDRVAARGPGRRRKRRSRLFGISRRRA